jgi:hypothetical protein
MDALPRTLAHRVSNLSDIPKTFVADFWVGKQTPRQLVALFPHGADKTISFIDSKDVMFNRSCGGVARSLTKEPAVANYSAVIRETAFRIAKLPAATMESFRECLCDDFLEEFMPLELDVTRMFEHRYCLPHYTTSLIREYEHDSLPLAASAKDCWSLAGA